MKSLKTLLLLCLVLGLSLTVTAEEAEPYLEISNEYIRIVVNTSQQNRGRFSVGTTGGDPDRTNDRNKHLIYGGNEPWTSYTTIRVGNENWIFGSPTNRRAGRDGRFGEMVQAPEIKRGALETTWNIGPIEVTQRLSFARSSTTGLMDTARIEYQLHNTDNVTHLVGTRLMLDTMLGENDGAPFRVDDQALLTDTVFYSHQMPEFWQAFDSLSNPQVMAQGTLRGQEVTTPDRVYFANWGSLADDPWNFDFQPGRDFTRKGEFDLDSALALFWDSKPLQPGETRSLVAHYGLGGVTIAPGDLSLGVTSPARVTADETQRQSFPIIAYIQNTGRGEARDVEASIQLPQGLQLLEGSARRQLNNLEVGETVQTSWQVIPSGEHSGELTYTVRVDALNSESNEVRRDIQIVTPAKIDANIVGPLTLSIENERLSPKLMEVTAILRNVGGIEAHRVAVTIEHPIGLGLASGERTTKYPGVIEPGEEIEVTWYLQPQGVSGNLPYSLKLQSSSGQQVKNNFVIIPPLEPKLWVAEPKTYGSGTTINPGDYFSLAVWATNIRNLKAAEFDLSFDPNVLEIVGKSLDISKGTLFVDSAAQWRTPQVDNATGSVSAIRGELTSGYHELAFGTLVTIHFRAKDAGTTEIALNDVKITTDSGVLSPSSFRKTNREITVEPK